MGLEFSPLRSQTLFAPMTLRQFFKRIGTRPQNAYLVRFHKGYVCDRGKFSPDNRCPYHCILQWYARCERVSTIFFLGYQSDPTTVVVHFLSIRLAADRFTTYEFVIIMCFATTFC